MKDKISGRKLKWFRAAAIATPLIILIIAELFLRVIGYGHNTDLFIRYPDDNSYWVINKYASARYFSDTANATTGSIETFKVEKPANTVRLFVLGESTTAGYPYFHNGSFHRWLQYRLMHTYPDMHFEIINVSLTAVNSYTVLDFGRQVVNYQPDGVLIYTGHNEYYGALGVGSTSHIANSRFLVQTVLQLRKFRLVQLFENVIRGVQDGASVQATDKRENLMKRMAASQEIAYNSEAYHTGINQFQSNMDELCALMQDKNIPVFLSTLVSNEKDEKPFISANTSTDNANQQFALANASYRFEDYPLAKQQYIKAKEFDLLRFRAPEAMNRIILKLAEKYNNVHLVDARKAFEVHSPHGILGSGTLLEHVHPNLYGYALLSDAFYQSIQQARLIKRQMDTKMSFAELLNKMPVTTVDSLNGAYTIMMLKVGWPFNVPIPAGFKRGTSINEQLAGALSVNRISWLDAMNQLFQYSMKINDKPTALKAVEAVMLESTQNITYKIYAGRLSFDLGNYADAALYLRMAYEQDPSFANTQDMYLVYLKTDQPEKSVKYIESDIKQHPQDLQLNILLTTVKKIIQLKNELAASPGNKSIRDQIGFSYRSIAFDEVADKYK